VLALSRADGASSIDYHKENPCVLALDRRLAVDDKHLAGEPDQLVGMMGDIGDDGAGLCEAVSGPVSNSGGTDHFRPPAILARGISCAASQSCTARRR
jgi:hypothetical protein